MIDKVLAFEAWHRLLENPGSCAAVFFGRGNTAHLSDSDTTYCGKHWIEAKGVTTEEPFVVFPDDVCSKCMSKLIRGGSR